MSVGEHRRPDPLRRLPLPFHMAAWLLYIAGLVDTYPEPRR